MGFGVREKVKGERVIVSKSNAYSNFITNFNDHKIKFFTSTPISIKLRFRMQENLVNSILHAN